ncbi:hypothetical protein [Falsiroseomonas selenitidurans]|uniref:ADP-ribosylglycohydrolase n=1 Tax=Falsiroseomonas selenitidurans TaxID=2716335 RepID=A0ABX1ECF0_9PROT|nr:hypothetical protein [Falsiroseomonas selenitidurans]NKC34638.1 hypothetical protein [Falsiroseomonas selenitidurans]
MDRHIGKACDSAGIWAVGIGDALGDHAMSTAFGAVFEDLLGPELSDGRNLADAYWPAAGSMDTEFSLNRPSARMPRG